MSDEGRAYVKQFSPFKGSTFWVHYVLGDIANLENDYELWATNDYLMDEWPFSARAIDRARSELVEAGFISVLVKASPGRRPRYRFEFPEVDSNGRVVRDSTLANLANDGTSANLANVTLAKVADHVRQSGESRPPKTKSAPLVNKTTTEENKNNSIESEFEAVWNTYPRRIGRKAAVKSYVGRRKAGASADDLLKATRNYALATRSTATDFILHAATFFGPKERYLDYVDGIPESPIANQLSSQSGSFDLLKVVKSDNAI